MTPHEKHKRLDTTSKISACLLLFAFVIGMWTQGTLWIIPIALLYISTAMCNADCDRMRKQLNKNYGSGEEEHY